MLDRLVHIYCLYYRYSSHLIATYLMCIYLYLTPLSVSIYHQLLHSLVSGSTSSSSSEAAHTRRALLTQVVLPLHEPNEMVEWRTQVPVIQAYHPALVQLIILLMGKDREYRKHHPPHPPPHSPLTTEDSDSPHETSLLTIAIRGLLCDRDLWPVTFTLPFPLPLLQPLLHVNLSLTTTYI